MHARLDITASPNNNAQQMKDKIRELDGHCMVAEAMGSSDEAGQKSWRSDKTNVTKLPQAIHSIATESWEGGDRKFQK
jgi:hypothetical protein